MKPFETVSLLSTVATQARSSDSKGSDERALFLSARPSSIRAQRVQNVQIELVTKTRTNEKVVRESSGEQLLKGYRGEIAQRLMNTASVVEQQVFRNRI